jgi:hypothetical protein
MKTFAIASLAVLLSATTAWAGDFAVSKSTLDTMGLGRMHQLSDHDGLAIRGKGPFDLLGGGGGSSLFSSFPTGAGPRGPSFGGPTHGFEFQFPDMGGLPGQTGDPTGGQPGGGSGFDFGLGSLSNLFGLNLNL